MQNKSILGVTDQIFSPKQTQQRQARAQTLKKIDSQIQNILANNIQNNSSMIDFTQKLDLIQKLYLNQNKQLRESIKNIIYKYQQLQKLYLTTKEQLISHIDLIEQMKIQNNKKETQINKLKIMIKNQEILIDQYNQNIQQEIQLQKQLIKSTYDQQKIKIQKNFNHALIQMEKQYQDKIKKIIYQIKQKNYQIEFHSLKKYLQNNKENFAQVLKKSQSFVKKPISQYSTLDNDYKQCNSESKHHQAVFIP